MRARVVAVVALLGAIGFHLRERPEKGVVGVVVPAADTVAPTQQGDPSVLPPARDTAEQARDLALIQDRLREGAPGTYILEMLAEQGDTLARWPERMNEPIRVWIQPHAEIPDWNRAYPVVAERAFEEWREAGFPVQFNRMRDSAGTDIKILFVHQMPPEERRRIGVARRMRDRHGWLFQAEVVIATHDRSGLPLPAETVGGTARHEVGHVLGLGHSPNATDVMFPESRTPTISAMDRATLHLLYMLPPGAVK